MSATPADLPILYYDGECGLCASAVAFVIARDRQARFRFAPLQGSTAQARLGIDPQAVPTTMVLTDGRGRHERSAAALRVAQHLGGVWRLAAVAWVVPRPVRDAVYDFVALHRHRWPFGQAQCRLPSPEERARFLP